MCVVIDIFRIFKLWFSLGVNACEPKNEIAVIFTTFFFYLCLSTDTSMYSGTSNSVISLLRSDALKTIPGSNSKWVDLFERILIPFVVINGNATLFYRICKKNSVSFEMHGCFGKIDIIS